MWVELQILELNICDNANESNSGWEGSNKHPYKSSK